MNTLQNSNDNEMPIKNQNSLTNEKVLMAQHTIIHDFFQRDKACEMIGSIHAMIEDFLFNEDVSQVTPAMRQHIVNQLRVATLVAKLEMSCQV